MAWTKQQAIRIAAAHNLERERANLLHQGCWEAKPDSEADAEGWIVEGRFTVDRTDTWAWQLIRMGGKNRSKSPGSKARKKVPEPT